MPPSENTNPGQTPSQETLTQPLQQVQVAPTPTVPQDIASQTNVPLPLAPKKKSPFKVIVMMFVMLMLLVTALYGGYYFGDKHGSKMATPAAGTSEKVVKAIALPPEAIVTAECTAGRGKQYIIPKDIPKGPIYDVNNGKVIAIEYLIEVKDLLANPGAFSGTVNSLMKNYTVDHFTLVPTEPHAGETGQHVHLIMFIIPEDETAKITCTGASGTTEMKMTDTKTH